MAGKFDALVRDLWWFRKNVPCLDACPVKTDAGRYVQLIAEGRFAEAYRVARDPNPIASICGRACGAPCEDACRRGKIDAPVTIRSLKRFLTDQFGPESLSSSTLEQVLAGSMGGGSVTPLHADQIMRRKDRSAGAPRVAVVGAGPAGLACAHDLALMGYRVTVFEAMPRAGGMMRYGIPAYRLAREVIDRQASEIEAMGVEFRYSTPLTAEFGVRELMAGGFGAVFIAVGASRGRDVPIENADADGVVKAIDYLLNINRGYRVPLGNKVVVVGGGLVAIDAARTAVRAMVPGLSISPADEQSVQAGTMRVALDVAREAARHGALKVDVVSLESDREMPAMKSEQGREELEVAKEESVSFLNSWGPKRIIVRDGKAVGIELVRCTRVFDDAGRFRPEFDETQRRTLDADTVILAIGQAPDLSFLKPGDGVETSPAGSLKIDPVTLATNVPGVFGGGDAAFPPSLLITVAQHGKLAARSIDAYLHGETIRPREMHVTVEELPTDSYKMTPRYEQLDRFIPIVPLERRSGITEVEPALSADEAKEQASRCLYCHVHPIYDGAKCILCNRCVDICPEHCLHFVPSQEIADQARIEPVVGAQAAASVYLYDEAKCIRCGLCAIRCPTSAITMERFQFEETEAT
ncbi:MAG TPA: FAD-dependent oxidoreductase [Candidatus Acidoferrales bacterium]|nr:FAD-dependent oxidoreductase [Candidatus Acidoferrales bacterium]